uniref:Uncharacterized protein n=1 Tax=Pundamilia nyererei TaxID=303518 RepID=A0A3B4H5H1_9CICH
MQKVGTMAWIKCNTTPSLICEYTLTNMPQGEQFKFRVMACNAGGSGEPAEVPGTVTVTEMLGKNKQTFSKMMCVQLKLVQNGPNFWYQYFPESPEYDLELKYKDLYVVRYGGVLRLSVPIKGKPQPTCKWSKDGGLVSARAMIASTEDASELVIKGAERSDSAETKPSLRKEMDEVTAKLGQPAVMKCQIIGRPVPEIKWYHAGKEIIESRKYEMSSDGRNHSLSIMTDQQEDEGEYTCKAINDAGEAETTGMLVLEAAPSFHPDYPLKEIHFAGLGTTLRIHAVYIGRPEPKIMWLHGAKTLENTEDISIETTEHYTHLVIKNVQRRVHGGKYRIRLHNHFGRADTAFSVEIYDKPDIPQGPIVLDALLKNSVIISWKPPKDDGGCMITNYIVEKREDREGSEWELVSSSINGTSCRVPNLIESAGYFFRVYAQNRYGNSKPLELTCPILIKSQLERPSPPLSPVVSGITKDSCVVSWKPPLSDGGSKIKSYYLEKKNKKDRREWTEWTPVTTDEIKQTVFSVKRLTEGVEHIFRVKCENLGGQSDYSEETTPIIPDKEAIPALRGEVVNIKIPFSGKPDPVITWQKGQDLIDSNGHYQVIVTRSFTSLVFPNGVEKKDAGFYIVCAKNRFGIDQQTVELDVADVPDPPRGVKASDVARDSVTLNWVAPANDGGSKVISYIIEKCPTTAERWQRVAQSRDTHYTVTNLFGGTSYQFRIIAENKFGQSAPSESSGPVMTKEDKSRVLLYDREVDDTGYVPRSKAPHSDFTLPLVNHTAYMGEDVRFGVTITVHPEPRVIWHKSGQKLIPGHDERKYTFISDKGLYQLIIHNVETEDDAEYSVVARNSYLRILAQLISRSMNWRPLIVGCTSALLQTALEQFQLCVLSVYKVSLHLICTPTNV